MLERFLDDLGRELARDHAPENVQARLIEAELHLREGIEARLELGMGFAQAQREALEAFGRPVALVQGERPSAWPRLASITVAYTLFVLMFFSAWWAATPPLVTLLVSATLLLWAALAMAFAVNAFRSRRPAPRSVFATGCAASFAIAMILGSTTIPRRGAGLLPRSKAFAAGRLSPHDSRGG